MIIREIKPSDDPQVAAIIREVLTEFKADPKTSALGDPSVDKMFAYYCQPRSMYYVIESGERIYGGGGIRQLDGTGENICELQKMYFLAGIRGKGFGMQLLGKCISKAKEFGYKKIYIETFSHMHNAISLYEKNGFNRISHPKGNTGHGSCNVFLELDLSQE